MKTIPFLYQMAVTPPRNPDSWTCTMSERG